VVVIDLTQPGEIDSDVMTAMNSGVVVVMIALKAIDSDRMAAVNSDVGIADSESGAVMSLAAMAAVDSGVPVWEVPVGVFID
jgi:hypothetical protein